MKLGRRAFLKSTAGLGATALITPTTLLADKNDKQSFSPSSSFSFVHVTDQHVQARRKGDEGYLKCIQSINAEKSKPEFVVMGGDMVFDGNYNPKEKYLEDIKIYKEVSNELDMPYFHCMGNHDSLGLSSRRKVPSNDPGIGKKCIMELLEWPSSYYSFNHKGWHFIVLDCFEVYDHPKNGPSYNAKIDPQQLEWLRWDLGRSNPMPTVVFLHVPMFFNIGQIQQNMEMKAMSRVIANTKDVRLILERHNVKAVVQGHTHQIDEFMYNGIWYITSAAASACWWSGSWNGFDTGYTVFKCNGSSLNWEHVTYPWIPQLEPEDTLERKKTQERAEFLKQQAELRKEEIKKGNTIKPVPTPKVHANL